MTKEALEQLLARLDADPERAGVAYLALCRKLSNYLRLCGHASPEDAADQVLDRVAVALVAGKTDIQNFTSFCYGVARNFEREESRQQERLGKALRDPTLFFFRKKAQPNRKVEFMRECFAQLGAADQQFLTKYHTGVDLEELARQRLTLAAEMQVTLNQLRLRVHRLRNKLAQCVQRKRSTLRPHAER